MPGPLLTFEGGAAAQFCACAPPDSDGDVGPNHYVEAINSAFAVFDKTGTMLAGPITYNTLFAPLTGTPCRNQNDGDPFVMYDQIADRWVISDFAFPGFLALAHSFNASPCLRPTIPLAAAGFSMQSNMSRPNPCGWAITRRWRCGLSRRLAVLIT